MPYKKQWHGPQKRIPITKDCGRSDLPPNGCRPSRPNRPSGPGRRFTRHCHRRCDELPLLARLPVRPSLCTPRSSQPLSSVSMPRRFRLAGFAVQGWADVIGVKTNPPSEWCFYLRRVFVYPVLWPAGLVPPARVVLGHVGARLVPFPSLCRDPSPPGFSFQNGQWPD